MKKIIIILSFLFIPTFAFAISGACSSHTGVNCSIRSTFATCNDGFVSSTLYSQTDECQSSCIPPIYPSCSVAGTLTRRALNGSAEYNPQNVTGQVNQCETQIAAYQANELAYQNCLNASKSSAISNISSFVFCPPDSTQVGTDCVCNDGYTKWKDICIIYDENCQFQYGIHSYGDKNGCYCSTGYQFNSDKTACVQITCYANSSLINNQCVCNDGYINRDGSSCISYTDDCIRLFGANTVGIKGQNNNSSCNCEDGFEWNSTQTACVKKVVAPVVSPQLVNPPPVKKVKPIQPTTTVQDTQKQQPITSQDLIDKYGFSAPTPQPTIQTQPEAKPQTKSNNIFSNIWNFIKNIFK